MNQGCTGRISSQKWISVQVRLFDRQMINANDKGIATVDIIILIK